MKDQLQQLVYEVELQPGEMLTLPPDLVAGIGAGRWLITVRPADAASKAIRGHDAFLNGYSDSDEGLYDDSGR